VIWAGQLTGKWTKADNPHWRIAGLIEEIDVVDADANRRKPDNRSAGLGPGLGWLSQP
jgi:hypothetical protein